MANPSQGIAVAIRCGSEVKIFVVLVSKVTGRRTLNDEKLRCRLGPVELSSIGDDETR
jgi:hypothetical protein